MGRLAFYISISSAIATSIGVVLVWLTLREARRTQVAIDSLGVSRDTAQRQLRAYLVVSTAGTRGVTPVVLGSS